ncbi:MAG: hypothetical protein CL694_14430 [Chloroflexi bacterium]|nr:hypothetical protein [Chloroflexota bacterium]MDP6421495.1 ABC transporter permease [SAR202 cluster bacterium]HAL49513.1 hypothetical protein [Dehalococcoidia bacterium]MDP6664766.1 ABC transporter permease [SAR202 cluster bacterium]MDP6800686.1 ABC transporter permease [SAR202 cluster bacterium]
MGLTLRQAMLIAAKDTRVFLKDRFAVGFAFLFPLLFVAGFSMALGDVAPDDQALRITMATREQGGISRQIIESAEASSEAEIVGMAYELALAKVEGGTLDGFISFPADFTESVLSGNQTTLEVIVRASRASARAALEGMAQGIAARTAEMRTTMLAIAELSGGSRLDPPNLNALASGVAPLLTFEVQQVGDIKPFKASDFTLPGYLTMFVFFAAAISAEAITRERQTHTLERLLSNRARREAIVLGKYLGTAYRGLAQLVVMWVVGILVFDIDLGVAPGAVILISVLMALASAGFGVMLASFVKEVRAASSAAVLASLVLAPIGGCWWPLFITPSWMQSLAKLTPHGWANTGFNKLMLFGAEFGDVAVEMAALTAFGAAFTLVALWRFRLSAS